MPPFWTIGCLYGASSVMLGAFGAHGLKKRISDPARIGTQPALSHPTTTPSPPINEASPPYVSLTATANWGTAAQYQLIHSAVLTFASVAAPQNTLAMSLFTAGMTMFSGSLYLLVLDPQRWGKYLGPVTPIGGLALIGGWVALAVTKRPIVPKFK